MMTAEFMLSKRPVLRFTAALFFLLKIELCFVVLEKVNDRIPEDKLWAVFLQYGVNGQLLTATKSLYMHSKVCVHVNSVTTNLSD